MFIGSSNRNCLVFILKAPPVSRPVQNNRIYDEVEAETRKSQPSFQII